MLSVVRGVRFVVDAFFMTRETRNDGPWTVGSNDS